MVATGSYIGEAGHARISSGRRPSVRTKMKTVIKVCVVFVGLIASAWADSGEKEKDRIKESVNVLKDILEAPDKESVAAWFQKMGMPTDSITALELEGERGVVQQA